METLIYYLGLYALVYLLKFISIFRGLVEQTNSDKEFSQRKIRRLSILDVSLDLVYTSAGFAIALIENLPNWIPAIMILYIFLIILSASVDTLSFLSVKWRTFIHTMIAVCVIITTIVGYKTNFGKPEKVEKSKFKYKVVVPYMDLSLIKHAGLDFEKAPENNYRIIIEAKDDPSAKQIAIDSFFNCSTNYPLYGERTSESKRNQLRINSDEIVTNKIYE